MPQGPIQTLDFVDGTKTAFNINQPTVVKAAPGMLSSVIVATAGTGNGAVYDSASTANCTTANQIGTLPDTAGGSAVRFNFPVASGITVQPGAGQMVTVVYR